MFRLASVTSCVLACFALVSSSGCDKPDQTVVPEPEPEPEPEPYKPSNTPSQTWEPLWATASGEATANLVGIRGGNVYALAGEYGEPPTHLVAFAEDTGALKWSHAGKQALTVDGASDVLVATKVGETTTHVAVKNGKKAKPKAGEAEAVTPFDAVVAAEGCTADGVNLTCGYWTVAENGAVSTLIKFNEQVCYAVATVREVRCRAMETGDLAFAITVPTVEGVKDPGAVNYQFLFANGKLYISNYDGSVLAFGPAAGAAAAPEGEVAAPEGDAAAAGGDAASGG